MSIDEGFGPTCSKRMAYVRQTRGYVLVLSQHAFMCIYRVIGEASGHAKPLCWPGVGRLVKRYEVIRGGVTVDG